MLLLLYSGHVVVDGEVNSQPCNSYLYTLDWIQIDCCGRHLPLSIFSHLASHLDLGERLTATSTTGKTYRLDASKTILIDSAQRS